MFKKYSTTYIKMLNNDDSNIIKNWSAVEFLQGLSVGGLSK